MAERDRRHARAARRLERGGADRRRVARACRELLRPARCSGRRSTALRSTTSSPILPRLRRSSAGDRRRRGVELTGLGGSRRHWLMRTAQLADGTALVRFVDRSEARAAEQMRVDFVANASHELRTPLSTLIGYTETLREQGEEIDPGDPRALPVGGSRRGAADAARRRGPDLAVADRGREVHRADRCGRP